MNNVHVALIRPLGTGPSVLLVLGRERGDMARKKRTAEQVIDKLREAEVAIAQGQTVAQACRQIGVTEQTLRFR